MNRESLWRSGDKVICVDPEEVTSLVAGREYTIDGWDDEDYLWLVEVAGGWMRRRFVKREHE